MEETKQIPICSTQLESATSTASLLHRSFPNKSKITSGHKHRCALRGPEVETSHLSDRVRFLNPMHCCKLEEH